jgi:hypothetical protein
MSRTSRVVILKNEVIMSCLFNKFISWLIQISIPPRSHTHGAPTCFLFTYYCISFSFIDRVRVHISIQSYGNNNFHMSARYTLYYSLSCLFNKFISWLIQISIPPRSHTHGAPTCAYTSDIRLPLGWLDFISFQNSYIIYFFGDPFI